MKVKKEQIDSLFRDGFIHVKSFLDNDEIILVERAIKSNLDSPSPFSTKISKGSDSGEFFMDFNNWRRLPLIEEVCKLSKLINFATDITMSKKCWLFHDHILVKSGNAQATPIHHDRPYHIFKGNLNCSIWMTVDDVKRDSSLIFYKNTHKLDRLFLPKAFRDGKNFNSIDKIYSDIDKLNLDNYIAIDFEMKSGDAIIFFNNCLHRSRAHSSGPERRALSVRYLMDGSSLTKKFVNATPPFDRMGVKIYEDGPVPESFFPLLRSL